MFTSVFIKGKMGAKWKKVTREKLQQIVYPVFPVCVWWCQLWWNGSLYSESLFSGFHFLVPNICVGEIWNDSLLIHMLLSRQMKKMIMLNVILK